MLLLAVTRAHALTDGDERASLVICDDFLAANGRRLADDEDALFDLAMAAAAGAGDDEVAGRVAALVRAGAAERPLDRRLPDLMHRLATA